MWHFDLQMPINALLTMQQPINALLTLRQPINALLTMQQPINALLKMQQPIDALFTVQQPINFLQFWCSSVNHEAKCVHLQPPWSFWWHLAHIWKFGLILDFMSLMTPALPTALGYYFVAAFQKDKSHPTAWFRMSRVFPHRLCIGIASQHQWCLAVWVETGFHCKQLRFCLASSLVVSLAVCGPGHTLQNSKHSWHTCPGWVEPSY